MSSQDKAGETVEPNGKEEIRRLKADLRNKCHIHEQEKTHLEQLIITAKSETQAKIRECNALGEDLKTTRDVKASALSKCSNLQDELHKEKADHDDFKKEYERTKSANRDLMEREKNQKAELARINDSLNEMRSRVLTESKKLFSTENTKNELSVQNHSLENRVNELERENDLLTHEKEAQSKKLKIRDTQISELHSSKTQIKYGLRTDLDEKVAELKQVTRSYENLKSSHAIQEKQVQQYLNQLNELRTKQSEEQSVSARELTTQTRLATMEKKNAEGCLKQLNDVEQSHKQLQEKLDEEREAHERDMLERKGQIEELQNELKASKEERETLEDQLGNTSVVPLSRTQRLPSSAELDKSMSTTPIPSFSAEMSKTTLYAKLVTMKMEFEKSERLLNDRTRTLSDLTRQLENEGPRLQAVQTRSEEIARMSQNTQQRLSDAKRELEQMGHTNKDLQMRLREAHKEKSHFELSTQDLQRQLAKVLRQDISNKQNEDIDFRVGNVKSDMVELVTYENVEDFVKKHNQLVTFCREMEEKLGEKNDELNQYKLESENQVLRTENARLKDLQKASIHRMDTLTQQVHVMKKQVLTKKNPDPGQSYETYLAKYNEVEKVFKEYRQAKQEESKTSADRLQSARDELMKVKVSDASLRAENTHLSESRTLLDDRLSGTETDLQRYRDENEQIRATCSEAQYKLRTFHDENIRLKERVQLLEVDKTQAELMVEKLKYNTAGLEKNNKMLREFNHKQLKTFESLQSLNKVLELRVAEITEGSAKQEEVRSELATFKRKYETDKKSAADYVKQTDIKINMLLAEKEVYDKKRKELEDEAVRVAGDMKGKDILLEERTKQLDRMAAFVAGKTPEKSSSSSVSSSSSGALGAGSDKKESEETRQQLQVKLADSRKANVLLQGQLDSVQSHIKDFENLDAERLKEVAEAKKLNDEYVKKATLDIKAVEEERRDLKEQVSKMREQIRTMDIDFEELRSKMQTSIGELREQYNSEKQANLLSQKKLNAAVAEKKELSDARDKLKEMCEEHNEKYEQEVARHGQHIQELTRLRKDILKITELESQVRVLEEEKKKLKLRQDELNETIDSRQIRIDELEKTNKLYMNMFEEKHFKKKAGEQDGESSSSSSPGTDELEEKLNSQNELVVAKQTEAKRLKQICSKTEESNTKLGQKLKVVEAQLKETKKQLAEATAENQKGLTRASQYSTLVKKYSLSQLAERDNRALKERVSTMEEQLKLTRDDLSDSRESEQSLEEKVLILESKISELAAQEKILVEESDSWKTRANNLLSRTKVVDKHDFDKVVAELDKLKREHAGLTNKYDETKEQSATSANELKELLQKYEDCKKQSDVFESENSELSKHTKELEAKQTATASKMQILAQQVKKARTLKKQAEDWKSKYEILKRQLHVYQQKVKELTEKNSKLRAQKAQKDSGGPCAKCSERQELYTKLQKRFKVVTEQNGKLKQAHHRAKNTMNDMKAKLKACENESKELQEKVSEKQAEVQEKVKELNTLTERYARLRLKSKALETGMEKKQTLINNYKTQMEILKNENNSKIRTRDQRIAALESAQEKKRSAPQQSSSSSAPPTKIPKHTESPSQSTPPSFEGLHPPPPGPGAQSSGIPQFSNISPPGSHSNTSSPSINLMSDASLTLSQLSQSPRETAPQPSSKRKRADSDETEETPGLKLTKTEESDDKKSGKSHFESPQPSPSSSATSEENAEMVDTDDAAEDAPESDTPSGDAPAEAEKGDHSESPQKDDEDADNIVDSSNEMEDEEENERSQQREQGDDLGESDREDENEKDEDGYSNEGEMEDEVSEGDGYSEDEADSPRPMHVGCTKNDAIPISSDEETEQKGGEQEQDSDSDRTDVGNETDEGVEEEEEEEEEEEDSGEDTDEREGLNDSAMTDDPEEPPESDDENVRPDLDEGSFDPPAPAEDEEVREGETKDGGEETEGEPGSGSGPGEPQTDSGAETDDVPGTEKDEPPTEMGGNEGQSTTDTVDEEKPAERPRRLKRPTI